MCQKPGLALVVAGIAKSSIAAIAILRLPLKPPGAHGKATNANMQMRHYWTSDIGLEPLVLSWFGSRFLENAGSQQPEKNYFPVSRGNTGGFLGRCSQRRVQSLPGKT